MPFYPAADHDVQPAPAPARWRAAAARAGSPAAPGARRYPSDMTEAEWAVCEPLLPAPAWLAGRGGRPASWCMRDIVDAIRYLTHNGPVWRALPADFPPAGTVYWWADKWQADGSAERMHDDLRDRVRLAAGREGGADGGDHRFPVGEGLGDDRPQAVSCSPGNCLAGPARTTGRPRRGLVSVPPEIPERVINQCGGDFTWTPRRPRAASSLNANLPRADRLRGPEGLRRPADEQADISEPDLEQAGAEPVLPGPQHRRYRRHPH